MKKSQIENDLAQSETKGERMKTRILSLLAMMSLALIFLALGVRAQAWAEKLPFDYSYRLTGLRILTVASDMFNYEETVVMSEYWRRMGAQVDYAGPERIVKGEEPEAPPAGSSRSKPLELTVDKLLAEVDVSQYDLIYFAGGEGIGTMVREHGDAVRRIIDGALQKNKSVAALCHAPMVLSVSGSIKGRRVTANGAAETKALRDAGAVVVDEVFAADGPFLTGQWPFLQTFAVNVAEKFQFPGGDGPYAKYLAGRSIQERSFDGLRNSYRLSGRAVDEKAINRILQSAFKIILVQPWGNFPVEFRIVKVTDPEVKKALAKAVGDEIKSKAPETSGSPQAVDQITEMCFVTPPVVCFAFVDLGPIAGGNARVREMNLYTSIVRYGSALENIALTARSSGLGIAMLAYPRFLEFGEQAVKESLAVPESVVLVDMFALGYPEYSNPPALSRDIAEMIMNNRWNAGIDKNP